MANLLYQKNQLQLPATVLTDCFTCPAGIAVVCSIYICNRGAAPLTFRLAISLGGAADALKQYLYYDAEIPANDSLELKPFTLNQADVIRIYAGTANASVTISIDDVKTLAR